MLILHLGMMSLTRIKDAFAIFKNLVLESRAGRTSISECAGHLETDAQRQIEDLRSCLLQRDTEIAILVNMVKKGKNNGTDIAFSADSSRNSNGVVVAEPDCRPKTGDSSSIRSHDHLIVKKQDTAKKDASNSFLKEDRETRIISRHLFGVPPPADRSIFDDMPGMISYFIKKSKYQ